MKRFLCMAALTCAPLFSEYTDKDDWKILQDEQVNDLCWCIYQAYLEDDIPRASKYIRLLYLVINDDDIKNKNCFYENPY